MNIIKLNFDELTEEVFDLWIPLGPSPDEGTGFVMPVALKGVEVSADVLLDDVLNPVETAPAMRIDSSTRVGCHSGLGSDRFDLGKMVEEVTARQMMLLNKHTNSR